MSPDFSVPQASVWHTEKKTDTITEYFCIIVDGEKSISFILTEYASSKSMTASPYNPGDFDYTVHDSCDHEDDYCVLEDPRTSEFQEVEMNDRIRYEIKKLQDLEQAEQLDPHWQQAIAHFRHRSPRVMLPISFSACPFPDLPRTNNGLEQSFGSVRRSERRATGRRGAVPGLVVNGAVRVQAAASPLA